VHVTLLNARNDSPLVFCLDIISWTNFRMSHQAPDFLLNKLFA